ncbi:MAG TPA: hypothetical protein VGE11_21065, partial [Pseudonocardia sp.]
AAWIAAALAALATAALVVATPLIGVTGGALATLVGEAGVTAALAGLTACRALWPLRPELGDQHDPGDLRGPRRASK